MTTTLSSDTTLVELSFYRLCGHGEYKRRIMMPTDLAGDSVIRTTCPACGLLMIVLTAEVPR